MLSVTSLQLCIGCTKHAMLDIYILPKGQVAEQILATSQKRRI